MRVCVGVCEARELNPDRSDAPERITGACAVFRCDARCTAGVFVLARLAERNDDVYPVRPPKNPLREFRMPQWLRKAEPPQPEPARPKRPEEFETPKQAG